MVDIRDRAAARVGSPPRTYSEPLAFAVSRRRLFPLTRHAVPKPDTRDPIAVTGGLARSSTCLLESELPLTTRNVGGLSLRRTHSAPQPRIRAHGDRGTGNGDRGKRGYFLGGQQGPPRAAIVSRSRSPCPAHDDISTGRSKCRLDSEIHSLEREYTRFRLDCR